MVGWWSTCWWVGGRLSVVSGSVEHLLVGRWSVVGGRWVGERPVGGSVVSGWWCVGGFAIRPKCVRYYKVHQVLQGVKDYY